MNAVSGVIESGHVYVPEDAPWLDEYLDQWAGFPAVPHDDMVDSSTQALSHMLFTSGDPLYGNASYRIDDQHEMSEEEAFLNGDMMYDVYDQSGGWY